MNEECRLADYHLTDRFSKCAWFFFKVMQKNSLKSLFVFGEYYQILDIQLHRKGATSQKLYGPGILFCKIDYNLGVVRCGWVLRLSVSPPIRWDGLSNNKQKSGFSWCTQVSSLSLEIEEKAQFHSKEIWKITFKRGQNSGT